MTRQDFIQNITNEITISGSLNVELKQEEIERIIDNEKRYVFRHWRDTVELRYGMIPIERFATPEFRQSRTIQMPDCVWGVQEFRECKDGSRLFGVNLPELSFDRVMNSDLYLSGIGMTNVLVDRMSNYLFYDQMRGFTLTDIQFNFNINTKKLQVIGHDPRSPVLCRVWVQIEDSALYDDYMFYKWVAGKCMINLHRVLKTFTVTLIGGVQIGEYFKEIGQSYIDEVKEFIKENQQPDWFIMFS